MIILYFVPIRYLLQDIKSFWEKCIPETRKCINPRYFIPKVLWYASEDRKRYDRIETRFIALFYGKNEVSAETIFIFIFYCATVSRENFMKLAVLFSDYFGIKNETGWWFHDFKGQKLTKNNNASFIKFSRETVAYKKKKVLQLKPPNKWKKHNEIRSQNKNARFPFETLLLAFNAKQTIEVFQQIIDFFFFTFGFNWKC